MKNTSVLCTYYDGHMALLDRGKEFDGEYVFVANKPEDFSLYQVEAFNKFQTEMVEQYKKTEDKRIQSMSRMIFSRAELVTISNGKFEVPMKGWLDISSDSFDAEIFSDHIRFISRVRKEIYGDDKDIVEMLMKKTTL